MNETPEQKRQRLIDESFLKAGWTRGPRKGTSQYVGTKPRGDIRFKPKPNERQA
jgi:hypothetical protein